MSDAERNAHIRAVIAAAVAPGARGYALTYATTGVRHAARSVIKGWGGHLHPRSLCQPATGKHYHTLVEPPGDAEPVTCQRCAAALIRLGLA